MRSFAALAVAVGAPALILWACGGQLPGPAVCSERARCEGDGRCVLGRCREPGTQPVSTRAPRVAVTPLDVAWVSEAETQDLAPVVHLGKAGDGGTLYLRFAAELPDEARVQRALLVLDPMPDCPVRPGRLAVEVAHVLAPWRSEAVSAASRPKTGVPMLAADLSVTPARTLRIDVTEVVKAWVRHRQRYHGLALVASGTSPSGACITTGVSYGRGPRLEIYLWPEKDGEGGHGGQGGDGGHGGAGGQDGSGGRGGERGELGERGDAG